MSCNIGIISNKYEKKIINQLPNNTYIYCYINNKTNLDFIVNFLKGNNCGILICFDKNISSYHNDITIINDIKEIQSYKKDKKVILYNYTKNNIKDKKSI